MYKILSSLLSLSLFLALEVSAQTTILKADGYVDVVTGETIRPANIVIEDGLIKAINPHRLPSGAEIIDLSGKYLLPGFMDMHVHLDMKDLNFGVVTKESGSKGALNGAYSAEKTLMAGFTTVRSLGQVHNTLDLIDVALSEASNEGLIIAPRIIPSGHMISILGGHGDLAMGEGLAEGMLELGPEYGVISGVDDALKAVRFQIKHGAKSIKIHATAGVLSLEESVGAQQLTYEEMKTIIDEAHRHGITVAAHAHGTEGIKAAIRAGINSIDHGSILDEEAIQMMIANNVTLVPTTGLVDIIPIDQLDPVKAAKARYVLPMAKESVSKAIKAGVHIALGSDAPVIPHGDNMAEFFAMIDRGMTVKQAIQAATINAAELLKLEDRGSIKEGLFADIIAVDADPIKNVKTLEQITFVMKGGVTYKLVD